MDREIIDYKLVSAENPDKLMERVETLLPAHWVPHGGITFDHRDHPFQVLIKYAPIIPQQKK